MATDGAGVTVRPVASRGPGVKRAASRFSIRRHRREAIGFDPSTSPWWRHDRSVPSFGPYWGYPRTVSGVQAANCPHLAQEGTRGQTVLGPGDLSLSPEEER
jgi:hypothetical protein